MGIKIIAATLDDKQFTMYKENGDTILIPQGTPSLKDIVKAAIDSINKHGYFIYDENAYEKAITVSNSFNEFEKKTSGLVRFFKIAKEKVKQLFSESIEPVSAGVIPKPKMSTSIVDEIIANAQPVTEKTTQAGLHKQRVTANSRNETPNDRVEHAKDEDAEQSKATHTIVAVTDSGVVVPNVENIENQFKNANQCDGMVNFLNRLQDVDQSRIKQLLRFLERADLPIADDGSIIGYKALDKRSEENLEKGFSHLGYVDNYTGRVYQDAGCIVQMDKKLVDPNSRIECSSGLHIARRGYLSGFTATHIFLIKFNPEDVVALPNYDANKIRVCRYELLYKLPVELARQVRSNHPFTNTEEGKALLGKAIKGLYPQAQTVVTIKGDRGTDIEIVNVSNSQDAPAVRTTEEPLATSIEVTEEVLIPKVEVNEVIQEAEIKKPKQPTRSEKALAIYSKLLETTNVDEFSQLKMELLSFKKACKCTFKELGIPVSDLDSIKFTGKTEKPKQEKEKPVKTKKASSSGKPTKPKVVKPAGTRQEMLSLLPVKDKASAELLMDWKKKSKKGWAALGVDVENVTKIEKLLK